MLMVGGAEDVFPEGRRSRDVFPDGRRRRDVFPTGRGVGAFHEGLRPKVIPFLRPAGITH